MAIPNAQVEKKGLEDKIKQIFHEHQGGQALDVRQLVHLCEELELVSWSSGPNAMDGTYYALFLAGLLTLRELNRAKHLWRRLPEKDKNGLHEIWAVGQALWRREVSQAYVAIAAAEALPLNVEVKAVLGELKKSIGLYNASLLGRAYASVPIAVVAQALGLSLDDTLKFCASRQWRVQGDLVFPTKEVSANGPSTEAELEQLHQLSSYILHLEQRSVLKI
ncbi:COP9 signalosome complex subunit 8 [Aphanomyces cochlioides]|nr:COP9 signalosome complex subunit 8 [Aphanomyces cochlioides]